ncbi:MAG: hypothetical protein IJL47_03240 [Lachnospiraceae bacterium]|nr:hypothetical protein [Lachnospiraceae bacterium]
MEEKKTEEMIAKEMIEEETVSEEKEAKEMTANDKIPEEKMAEVKPAKKDIGYIILVAVFAVLVIAAPFITGKSKTAPKVLHHTWASDTVELTFSGKDKVVAVVDGNEYEGTYVNGTTGTNLVIWMHFDNAPDSLSFLESTRENYLIYSEVSDDSGHYMLIDGIKYFRK